MKFVTFLVFSLLLISYVHSKPIQLRDRKLQSSLENIINAEEFIESLPSKLRDIKASEDGRKYVSFLSKFTPKMIRTGPMHAIEIAEKLSEIEELIHQASEIQGEGDDLKEVLKKMEKVEEEIRRHNGFQKTDAINCAERMVGAVWSIKDKFTKNPNSFTELILQDEETVLIIAERPQFLYDLIKVTYPMIIENLWIAELAVESVKSVYPSQYEQLKRIIRDVEAKIFSMKRETKICAMEIQINRYILDNPETMEYMINLRDNLDETVELVYEDEQLFNEDQQEELVDKIIPAIPLLDKVNDQFIEDARNAVELFKSKFPEEAKKLDGFAENLRNYFDDFILSAKTIAEKIKLDTAEGVRTNPLYIEMFSRITKRKFADVHMTRWKIYKTIEDVILPLLPSQGEDKVIDEGVLALWKEDKKYRSGEPGPFDEFLSNCTGFGDFSPGLFPSESFYTTYHGV